MKIIIDTKTDTTPIITVLHGGKVTHTPEGKRELPPPPPPDDVTGKVTKTFSSFDDLQKYKRLHPELFPTEAGKYHYVKRQNKEGYYYAKQERKAKSRAKPGSTYKKRGT